MSHQLVKKGANGGYSNVMPKSWIEAIKDKNTGQTLVEILQGFNMYFLPYNGNTSSTRCLVPTMLRKKGLWITYVKYDGNVYTEWYAADEIDDKSWGDSSNWRIGNNTLVGDITISANGNWVINGTETEFKAVGEKGNTPLIRVANNRLQVSYNLGDTYIDVTSNPVYTKFRWLATSGDAQANNVGRIQASTDEGKTWTNMSNDFTNNLHISRYIGVNDSLPTSGIAEGTIYAKGPYYAEDDTLNDNPIYRLWVYAWKDNTLAWQDNGEFTSIAAGIVQETGNSETEVMSQKIVTSELSKLDYKINNLAINTFNGVNKEYSEAIDFLVKDGSLVQSTYKSFVYSVKEGDTYKVKFINGIPLEGISCVSYWNENIFIKSELNSPLDIGYEYVFTVPKGVNKVIIPFLALSEIDILQQISEMEYNEDSQNYSEAFYITKEHFYVNENNEEIKSSSFYLYSFNVENIKKVKLFCASGGGYILFTDSLNRIIGEPFHSMEDSYKSTWNDIDVPEGASILKVSSVINSSMFPDAYPCRLLLYKSNNDYIKEFVIENTTGNKFDSYGYLTELPESMGVTPQQAWFMDKPLLNDGYISSVNISRSNVENSVVHILIGYKESDEIIKVKDVILCVLSSGQNKLSSPIYFKKDDYIGFVSQDKIISCKLSGDDTYQCYASKEQNLTDPKVGLLALKSNIEAINYDINYDINYSISILDLIKDEKNYIDLVYSERKDGWVNSENIENTTNKGLYLYTFNVEDSTRLKLYFASGGGYALFTDINGNIVGKPFQSTPIGMDYFSSTWKDVDVPSGAVLLKVSQVKKNSSFPNAYPCRVLGNRQNYDELKGNVSTINKTMVNVGMSIWWQDGNTISNANTIDKQGGVNKGYQSWLNSIFHFPSIVKYSYSGFSLGIGDDPSQSIMNTKASSWVAQNNAIWTLDTITNDFGRKVALGKPSDFENNTGISTFYGALRAFKEKVAELSPNAVVVCSNALYRTAKQNGLGLTLEDYEKAMCYAAAKSGWYFVDQYRTSINESNAHVALYDGLHPTNFGFSLAVKPWIEQFRIIKSIL